MPRGKGFRSPGAAAHALFLAARADDDAALLAILGPDARDLISTTDQDGDRQSQRELFASKYEQMHRLVHEPDDTVALYVGAENWPLPIPIVEYNGQWYFDTALGKQEILYRQVGRNEMEALETCRALLDAEKEYYASHHTYTNKLVSDGNSQDGLYWQGAAKDTLIGPHLAEAAGDGSPAQHQPFHGYYYRILLNSDASGSAQPGALLVLAYPAEYRASGVMTFLVDENGNAYQKDLGPNTPQLCKQMRSAERDSTWQKVE
jgi:hypothetical protein